MSERNPKENFLPIFVSGKAEEAKIWWSQQVERRTRSLASDLSDRGPLCLNYEEWLKKLEDTSPAIEAEGQNTISVSTTKLLENGRDSETSTARVKHPGRVLPEKLGGGVRPASQNPYPIYDQNLRNSLPYL